MLISATPKFEDRSQEETEWQERNAREAAWKMTRCVLKLMEKYKTTFFPPSENLCLSSPQTIKPEEKEFVVDSGASMHMISKKDLNSPELETMTTSESPMTVFAANGEVQTNEEATVFVRKFDIFLTMKLSRIRQQFYRWGSFAMNMDIDMNGPSVKNHISLKMVFEYSVIRKTSYQSWFLNYLQLPQARLLQHPRLLQVRKLIIQISIQQSSQVKMWIDKHGETRTLVKCQKSCYMNQPKSPKPKNEDHEQVRRSPYSDTPEWLQEFRENLVDDRVPERWDSHSSSSHEPSFEPLRSADLGKHSVYTHLPKDRNCEICQRTKITRASRRRRICGAVLRAVNFGDSIAADHKVLSEGCESRNSHLCAVGVQDLTTPWIQSYPCKTKISLETKKRLQKF